MKYIACLWLLIGLSYSSYAQSSGKTITPFQRIYDTPRGTVSIQYLLFPCSSSGTGRYGFKSTFELKRGTLTGVIHYQVCEGNIKTQDFTVYLDKPGEVHDDGAWIDRASRIIKVDNVELHDPEADEQKQRNADEQKRAEQQRQADAQRLRDEQRQAEEQRQLDAQRLRDEQSKQADESNRRLQEATQQLTDPNMKAQYERNQQIGQKIQDPVERQKFLDQQTQSVQQTAEISAIADAAAPLLADALDGLSNISLPDLKDTPNLGGIELGIANLLDPLIITNLTRSVSANPIGYYARLAALRRKGLSYNLSGHYLQMENDNSALYWPDTRGQLTNFAGTLKASMFTADFSIGKTLMTKSARLALYVGPFVSCGINFTHSFVFTNGGQTYTNTHISSPQIMYGGQVNAYWFITNGIALTGGIRYNVFSDNPFDQYLGTDNFKTYSAGLFFRFQ